MKLVEVHFQFLSQAKGSSIKGGRADHDDDDDEEEADKKLEQPHTDRGRRLPE